MSIKVMSAVWDHCEQKAESLIVMLAMADWCNDDGECYPSFPMIATKARITIRAAFAIIDRLSEAGEIERVKGGGRGRRNCYRLPRYVAQKRCAGNTASSGNSAPETVFPATNHDRETLFPVRETLNAAQETLNAGAFPPTPPLYGEPSIGTVNEPSGGRSDASASRPAARKPAAPKTSRSTRAAISGGRRRVGATRRGQGSPDDPENLDGPFRDVFRAICKVRRENPDLLNDTDRSNYRGLTSVLCRRGVAGASTVEEWGLDWYRDAAKRFRSKMANVSPPTIAQLTTWFGACMTDRSFATDTSEEVDLWIEN